MNDTTTTPEPAPPGLPETAAPVRPYRDTRTGRTVSYHVTDGEVIHQYSATGVRIGQRRARRNDQPATQPAS